MNYKHISLIILSIFTIACTNPSNSTSPEIITPTSPTIPGIIEDKTFNVSDLIIGEIEVSEDTITLPTITKTIRETSKQIHLLNTSSNPVALQIALDEGVGFKIKINRCGSILAANARCSLIISFNSRNLYNGLHSGAISINDTAIALSAEIIETPSPFLTGSPVLDVKFKDDKNFLATDAMPYREIQIKNTGNGLAKNLHIMEMPDEYMVRINRCPENLGPSSNCRMQMLYKNHRSTTPAPDREFNFNATTPENQLVIKSINSLTGETNDTDPTFTPVFSDFPTNTKTAICSGQQTVSKTLEDCKNPLGTSVALSKCSGFPVPTTTYKSPEGEFPISDSITGGVLYSRCEEGSSLKIASRAVCNTPAYYLQADEISCGVDSFEGEYQVVANPVPNACDGTQIVDRPLIPGSCVANENGPVADSFCSPTQAQTFTSPFGITQNPAPIPGGYEYFNCLAGLSSKNETTSVSCDLGFFDSGVYTCEENSLVISCTNESLAVVDMSIASPVIGEGFSCKVKTKYETISSASLSTVWVDSTTGNNFASTLAINANDEIQMNFGICGLNTGDRSGKIIAVSSSGQSLERDILVRCPVNLWGSGIHGDAVLGSTNLCNDGTNNTCVMQYKNLTINSGATVTTAQAKRGLVIYVNGNATINGTLTMTAKGVAGNYGGLSFARIKNAGSGALSIGSSATSAATSALSSVESYQSSLSSSKKGFIYTLASSGPQGGAARSVPGGGGTSDGAAGTSGTTNSRTLSTGGGGSGGAYSCGSTYGVSGAGSYGSAFSGGSGGGGSACRDGTNYGSGTWLQDGQPAATYGGAGGRAGINNTAPFTDQAASGGAGNNGGPAGNGGTAGGIGTGGSLILFVKGTLTVNGQIQSRGVAGGSTTRTGTAIQWGASGGGGSGGGNILIIHAGSQSGLSGRVSVIGGNGGDASGRTRNAPGGGGGAGSYYIEQVDK